MHLSKLNITTCVHAKSLQSSPTLWTLYTVAHQAPLSMGILRQEYWSGMPCPCPGDLPDSGIKPESLMSPALAGRIFTTNATWDAPNITTKDIKSLKFKSANVLELTRYSLWRSEDTISANCRHSWYWPVLCNMVWSRKHNIGRQSFLSRTIWCVLSWSSSASYIKPKCNR